MVARDMAGWDFLPLCPPEPRWVRCRGLEKRLMAREAPRWSQRRGQCLLDVNSDPSCLAMGQLPWELVSRRL